MKLFITQPQSPGDICCLTAAVRDLKQSHPEIRINVRTSAQELWYYNPYLDYDLKEQDADVVLKCEYPAINESNTRLVHFLYAFHEFLEAKLNLKIQRGPACVDIHLSEHEKHIFDNLPHPIAIGNFGIKSDFTCKGWEVARFQEVVNATSDKYHWCQIGDMHHNHKPLKNVENLIGKTTHRQLIALMYQASMVLTPISYAYHLSTMPWKYGLHRPCVAIAGGREPSAWICGYPSQQILHRCCCYDCNRGGGCWRSRIVPLHDGDSKDQSLCLHPVVTQSGQTIPMCLDDITADEVIKAIRMYK